VVRVRAAVFREAVEVLDKTRLALEDFDPRLCIFGVRGAEEVSW